MYQGPSSNGDPAANMALLDSLASDAGAHGAELLMLPELFSTGYIATADTTMDLTALIAAAPGIYRNLAQPLDGPLVARARSIAIARNISMVFTFLESNPSSPNAFPYDSAVLIDHDGSLLNHYRKVQIVGGVETFFLSTSDRGFGPVVNWHGINCSLLICNDILHPEPTDVLAGMGAQLILVPTANAAPLNDNIISSCFIGVRSNENGVTVVYTNFVQQQVNRNLSMFDFFGGSVIGGGPARQMPAGQFTQNWPLTSAVGLIYVNTYVPDPSFIPIRCPADNRDRYPQWYTSLTDASACFPTPPLKCDSTCSDYRLMAVGLGVGLGLGLPVSVALLWYCYRRRVKVITGPEADHYVQTS